jgi:hypothetical protein
MDSGVQNTVLMVYTDRQLPCFQDEPQTALGEPAALPHDSELVPIFATRLAACPADALGSAACA